MRRLEPLQPMRTTTFHRNSYPVGQCTWGVKELAPWASNWWGNANTWAIYASAQGYKTGSVPVVGAIAVWDGGEYGHVAKKLTALCAAMSPT